MTIDAREFRNALGQFSTGVCLITVHSNTAGPLALTANSFASVSLDPPLVLWSLQNNSDVFKDYSAPQHFAINVLSSAQQDISDLYARKGEHQLDQGHFVEGMYGSPLINHALARFECAVETTHDGGDHTIIVGRVLEMSGLEGGDPLLFYCGGYRALA
ncbi:MAG: flavin reductase (DIM6/NTAB) family NADH-FMN oxidoreductase RutF [Halieaceae bacterium]|jgi:flavin reductase (DIM6/NTAB) family NADH-FMN oxidoreductase RutF